MALKQPAALSPLANYNQAYGGIFRRETNMTPNAIECNPIRSIRRDEARLWEDTSRIFSINPPVTDDLSAVQTIRGGVSPELARHLEAALGIEYRRALIPDRTLLRRLSTGSALTAEEGERVLEAAHLLALALRVFGSEEKARKWLSTPKTRFNGSSPLVLATSAPGVRAIEQLLGEIEEGYFA
jgi:putative toxin-antitoxin system antitoxin component (TIGR02293 family)